MVSAVHYRDCGLACVLMVLRAAGIHSEDFSSLRSLCSITRCYCYTDLNLHLLWQSCPCGT